MASPLFCHGLLKDLGFQPLFGIHLLEPGVLKFQFLHPADHLGIHATIHRPPFVKCGGTDAKLTTDLRYRYTRLNALERFHDLTVREFRLLHAESPLRENSTSDPR